MNKSNVAILAFIVKTQLAISLNSVRVHVRAFEIVVDDDDDADNSRYCRN